MNGTSNALPLEISSGPSFGIDSRYVSGEQMEAVGVFPGKTLEDVGLSTGVLGSWTLLDRDNNPVTDGTITVTVLDESPAVLVCFFAFSSNLFGFCFVNHKELMTIVLLSSLFCWWYNHNNNNAEPIGDPPDPLA